MIWMIEPGTGEALEIPSTFFTFHEEEIIEFQDAELALEFIKVWRKENTVPLDQGTLIFRWGR